MFVINERLKAWKLKTTCIKTTSHALIKPSHIASFLTRQWVPLSACESNKDPLPDAFSFGFNSTSCQPGKRLRSRHRARLSARSLHQFSRINERALCVYCVPRER